MYFTSPTFTHSVGAPVLYASRFTLTDGRKRIAVVAAPVKPIHPLIISRLVI